MKQNKTILLFWRKQLRFKKHNLITVRFFAVLLIIFISSFSIIRKNFVHFRSEDGLLVSADNYFSDKTLPYILLFHQEKSSRGEFDSIAERFAKIGYNCLSVDLRSGEKFGYVENETAKLAKSTGKSVEILESLKDIRASIDYAYSLNGQKIILLGSASSASLVLLEGKNNEKVKAIIALSPGEYFLPGISVKSNLNDLSKKVFISCSEFEYPYIKEMFSEVNEKNMIIFKPSSGTGSSGTKALINQDNTQNEYWLSLLLFFKSLR